MTLKSLFFKLQKEDLKRRIWTIALAVLVLFLSMPIICAMSLGNFGDNMTREDMIEQIYGFMGPQYPIVIMFTVIGAIVCGLSGFFYLHSRKKVDLYHSIPVRRELLFAISYINGILIYIIPYILNVILCFIVLQINHFMSMEIFTLALSAIAVNLLFYCLIYTVVIIAVMLTGNFVISCFGTAVFLLYGSMIMLLKEMYFTDFFKSYYSSSRMLYDLQFLSPIGIYIGVVNKMESGMNQGVYWRIIQVLIVTILLIALGVFLYKKRPSEAAGKAMSFQISRPVIKFLLVIPLSLGGGIIFREIANKGSNGWFIFGLIFSLIIIYGIIEIMYDFDIRSAFHYKKQLLASAGVITIIACIFQFDLFHYDSYIPNENKINSMSVAISGLDDNTRYYEMESDDATYINNIDYQLKYMKLTDFDSAYALAKMGVHYIDNRDDMNEYYSYYVKYTLNNGKVVYRTYQLTTDESYDMMKDIYNKTEFKETHYQVNQLDIEKIGNISCNNMLSSKEFSLDITEKSQLLEIYKEELNNLTLDEISNTYPIATMMIKINKYSQLEYNVYPTFEKTIAFLKDHGFDARKEVEIQDIKQIDVNNYQALVDEFGIEIIDPISGNDYKSATYVDEEQLKEIYPNLVESNYYWSNRSIINADTLLDVNTVIRRDEYGNEVSYSFFFKKGTIPDFVKEDVRYGGK